MLKKVNKFLNETINPVLGQHQGGCKALSFNAGVLELELQGMCSGCPSSKMTVYNMIYPALISEFPEIEEVVPR